MEVDRSTETEVTCNDEYKDDYMMRLRRPKMVDLFLLLGDYFTFSDYL